VRGSLGGLLTFFGEYHLIDNKHVVIDQQVVEQLTHVADTMTSMLATMMEAQEGQSKGLDHFREDLKDVRNAIRRIAKVLHEGNGEKPLIARVAVLETRVTELRHDVSRLEKHEEDRQMSELKRGEIDRKGKYAIAVALASGLLALATTIISTWG